MSSQTTSGKAFEYAVLLSLQETIEAKGSCSLEPSLALKNAQLEFASLAEMERMELTQAASSAVLHLLHLEPHLSHHSKADKPIFLRMQADQAGIQGDVRDLVIGKVDSGWSIGISAKNRHEAVKHSRLSQVIDFGEKWLNIPCSEEYFQSIKPIFDQLSLLKAKAYLWSDVEDKENLVYIPLLASFKKELLRIDKENPGVIASRLACYLIGKQDFYKIMKFNLQTKIQVFNFEGSLNNPFGRVKPRVHLERLKLPRRIVELDFKLDDNGTASATTLELICDGGWQMSFRIHNASSKVEPSLKFDIGLIGRPNSLSTFHVLWD